MSDYAQTTNFTVKDSLPTGDSEKIALGADIDVELAALATMSATKEDEANKGALSGYCGLDGGGLVARSDLPAATSYTDTAEEYSAGKGTTIVTLTDAATVAVNAALGNVFTVTLGDNRTLGAPTNAIDGQVITLFVVQDGSGNRTLAWNAIYLFASAVAPTLSTGINDVDVFTMIYKDATTKWYVTTSGLDFG